MRPDPARLTDKLTAVLSAVRGGIDPVRIVGHGVYELLGPDGEVKARGSFKNLITDRGDEYYAKQAAEEVEDIVTGMRLGTDNTAPSKAGAGAAIVAYVTGSNHAFDSAPATSDKGAGLGYRITHVVTWSPGQATATGIVEAVITNETPLTDVAGTAANTVSRGLLSPAVNKGASDTLVVTWYHDFLGA